MTDVNPAGPPAAAPEASPAPQTTLTASEQALLAQIPDFMIPNADQYTLEHNLTFMPADVPAEVAPAPVEAAPAPAPVEAAPAPAPVEAAPDPVMAFLEKQSAVLEQLTARLAPPPPKVEAPPAKKLEDMTEEEAFVHLIEQRFEQRLAAALKPYEDERASAKAASAAADAQARQNALAGTILGDAVAQVAGIVRPELYATLTDEDKGAYADEILATQAANVDERGNPIPAAQAAQVVKARLSRLVALETARPAPLPGAVRPRAAQLARAPVPGSGSVTAPVGDAAWAPTREQAWKHYGRSAEKLAVGASEGWKKIPRS